MLTFDETAELHRLIHEYSAAEYGAGFKNAMAHMVHGATDADKRMCASASRKASAAYADLLEYMGGLLNVKEVMK